MSLGRWLSRSPRVPQPASPPRKVRPTVERLEDRIQPTYTATFAAGVAGPTVTFTGNGADDTLVITRVGGQLRHNRFTALDLGFNSDIDFDSSVAGDQIVATLAAASVTINTGAGNDTVRLGDATSPFSSLIAAFTINNTGIDGDTLILDDSARGTPNNITITNTTILGAGINLQRTGAIENGGINFFAGFLDDIITVHSTNVGEPVNIFAGAGNDIIHIGAPVSGLTNILGPVSVNADGGTDTLRLDDLASITANTYTISGSLLTRNGIAQVRYDSVTLEEVTLHGGSGNNSYNFSFVLTSTTIIGNQGTDVINVLNSARGTLTRGGIRIDGLPHLFFIGIERINATQALLDITEVVRIIYRDRRRARLLRDGLRPLRIQNESGLQINGPLAVVLVLDSKERQMEVANRTGRTRVAFRGRDYVNVSSGADNLFAPNEVVRTFLRLLIDGPARTSRLPLHVLIGGAPR